MKLQGIAPEMFIAEGIVTERLPAFLDHLQRVLFRTGRTWRRLLCDRLSSAAAKKQAGRESDYGNEHESSQSKIAPSHGVPPIPLDESRTNASENAACAA